MEGKKKLKLLAFFVKRDFLPLLNNLDFITKEKEDTISLSHG